MIKFRKIGVLTSGGDSPGMNATVRAICRTALDRGVKVMGIMGGYRGLINNNLVELKSYSVSNILNLGGTLLYSDRCLEFKTEEGMQKAIKTCRDNEIDAIVAIGGDGTFRGAVDLTTRGIPTIGIPGTIDNDVTATDYTIGFDTAMNTAMKLIDCLRNTCESHARCDVVEVMGRDCGQIALYTAIATGAVGVAIPEIPFDEDALIARMNNLKKVRRGMIVVVSEGVLTDDKKPYSEKLVKIIEEKTGIETKFARFAHIVRGGSPTLRDRTVAAQMGVLAVELLLEGKSNLVISEVEGKIVGIDTLYALTSDRMYKNKLRDGDLDSFSEEQIADMKALCEKRKREIARLYSIADEIVD